jgi:hypothetical protein
MRTSELLFSIAKWLESPNNEALLLSEQDDRCMEVVAESCVLAAELLKAAAAEVDVLEPQTESILTPESIDETAMLVSAFDASDDPQLKKIASVFDELLLTIAAPPGELAKKKASDNNRIDELRKKYQDIGKELHKFDQVEKSKKAIDKSQMTKDVEIHTEPLQTASCPDHPGAQMGRVGERIFRCNLDGRQYNYETGYTLLDGTKVPGGSVQYQTGNQTMPFTNLFDDRQGRLGYHQ